MGTGARHHPAGSHRSRGRRTGVPALPAGPQVVLPGRRHLPEVRDVREWPDDVYTQQAYLKAPNGDQNDLFGSTVALSTNGETLVVGAPWEDGGGPGVADSARGRS